MKKFLIICVSVCMCFLCACGSSPKDISIKYMDAIAKKDYETASKYSHRSPDNVEMLYADFDMSGYKFSEDTSFIEEYKCYVFTNEKGEKYRVVLQLDDNNEYEVMGASGFID